MVAWEKVLERLERQKARIDPEQRRYYLQLMRHTAETTVDGQGRISVPQHLVDAAGLGKEVLFVGAGEAIEMWDPRTYAEYVGESEADFESWFSKFL